MTAFEPKRTLTRASEHDKLKAVVGFCAAYDESRDRILVMTRDVSNADR
jgi:hypothetical protein